MRSLTQLPPGGLEPKAQIVRRIDGMRLGIEVRQSEVEAIASNADDSMYCGKPFATFNDYRILTHDVSRHLAEGRGFGPAGTSDRSSGMASRTGFEPVLPT